VDQECDALGDEIGQGPEGVSQFPTTEWTEIGRFRSGGHDQKQAIIASLFNRYRRPVYAWLRKRGYSHDVAEEYTQGFFCNIVLERDLVSRADRAKGRFRTFILNALKGFVSDEYRKAHANTRMPKQGITSIDDQEVDLSTMSTHLTPDDAFNVQLARDFLGQIREQLQTEYCQSGRVTHWEVFNQKVFKPLFEGAETPSYKEICARYDIPDTHKAAAMVTTVRRRYSSLLREAIRPLVPNEEAIDQEIKDLFDIFSRMGE
jgi:DNA-directed RNA polymerase specialized sigma24 family protein